MPPLLSPLPLALLLAEDSEPAHPVKAALTGIVLIAVGLLLLFFAVKKFRQAALIGSLRETPIRDIHEGVVRIFGNAEGGETLTSPIAGAACYYYDSCCQKIVGEKRTRSTVRDATKLQPFYLNDGTARVLVNQQSAEYDLPTTLSAQVNPEAGSTCKMDPLLVVSEPSEKLLRELIRSPWTESRAEALEAAEHSPEEPEGKKEKSKWWVPKEIEIEGVGSLSLESEVQGFSLTETCLLAGREYSIVGTAEKTQNADGSITYVIQQSAAKHRNPFVISSKRGLHFARSVRKNAWLIAAGSMFMLLVGIYLIVMRNRMFSE